MQILIEPHYFPSLEYFCAILPFDEVILEQWENFPKQTFRNRCYVMTVHGVKMMTVPLANRSGEMPANGIRVEPGNQWRNTHWRTIESAYRKAPFFDFYSDEMKTILYQGHENLFNLNRDLLSFCLRQVGLQKKISASVSYEKEVKDGATDLRSVIIDKKPSTTRNFYQPHFYHQVFGSEFAPNLSAIDLLFNEGPQSLALLKASRAVEQKKID
jgi:hypothetical protein